MVVRYSDRDGRAPTPEQRPAASAAGSVDERPPATNLRAIAAMVGATANFTCGDASMKVVSGVLPTGKTIFVRGLVSLVVLFHVAVLTGEIRNLRRCLTPAMGLRCLGDVGGAVFFQAALGRIKLADKSGG